MIEGDIIIEFQQDYKKRCTTTEFLVLYRIVRIAQNHPTGRYHTSLRALTTEAQDLNESYRINLVTIGSL